jgi:cytochrome P450
MNMPVYDPTDGGTRRDPFPLYAALQDQDPVHWSEALRCWVITRYADVRQIIRAPEISSDRLGPFYAALRDERRDILSGVIRYLNEWLVFKAPPEHTQLRKLLNQVFSPAMIAQLEPRIEATVAHILDPLDTTQPVEFMGDVAVLLPAYVILDLMGLPRSDFPALKQWSDQLRLFVGSARGDDDKYRKAREGADHMADYFRQAIAQRRAVPGEDVISQLVQAWDGDANLREDTLVATCMLILFGGHETTTNFLGSAVAALIDHPEQRQRLAQDPALMPSAIEEFLRFDGPSNSIARVVAQDHELGGKTLKSGQRLFAMINAANRDPRAFERPHELDVGRNPNPHLTFGQGLHFCLGARLAKLEAQVCLQALMQRYPKMRHAPGELQWLDALVMRGPLQLPLHLN